MKHTSPSEAISSSNISMFSRQCLSHPTRSPPTTTPTAAASRPPCRAPRWTLCLWTLVIAGGCLMLNAPTTMAFDIGEYRLQLN
ncbi:GD23394 [Drosophila simulans]|uniref:GD23394 n=1 Tax=Drosophila simulans TaxID=7240 RepID=B4Q4K1_DROSI|nr:GD23394 [Drosophila simulans]